MLSLPFNLTVARFSYISGHMASTIDVRNAMQREAQARAIVRLTGTRAAVAASVLALLLADAAG